MDDLIIKTKFIAPIPHKTYWKNELWKKYKEIESFPLTVVKAGPGYGKSTTLASFFNDKKGFYWYSIDELDADSALFFLNFVHAFKYKNERVGQSALEQLIETRENNLNIINSIDLLINDLLSNISEESYLILDDFHLVSKNRLIIDLLSHFINMIPPKFHLIISTREDVEFKEWANWRLKQQVLLIDDNDMSLNNKEIVEFFRTQYDIKLNNKDTEKIASETEGWIMALDLIGRGIKNGSNLKDILATNADSLEILFEYLAYEVLENQSEFIKLFLLQTSVLKNLRVNICNMLLGIENSQEVINNLVRKGLFVYKYGDEQYRYHHLFHEFLRKLARERYDYLELHSKAAGICLDLGERGFAIYHSLGANNCQQAAELIISSVDRLFELGRIETIQNALNQLSDDIYTRYPLLYNYQGDIFRLKSQYNDALISYKKASDYFREKEEKLNMSHTLQKIAMIYLDTVQPVKAEQYLTEALKLIDEENQWEESLLLKLIAENKANEGHLEEALQIQKKAESLDNNEIAQNNVTARVLLRTGNLNRAQEILEEKVSDEKKHDRIPRSHRESILILSLIHSFKGQPNQANHCAQGGIYLGKELNSPFIIAVAYMRLGHAQQLYGRNKGEEAVNSYQKALKIVNQIKIVRGRAEPLMGLALYEAFYGNANLGIKYAQEGLNISMDAGDEWLAGLLNIALGINYYFNDEFERSEEEFIYAKDIFLKVQDKFCLTIVRLWLLLLIYYKEDWSSFKDIAVKLYTEAEEFAFDYVFYKETFLGMRDPNLFAPALIESRDRDICTKYVETLLAELGFTDIDSHPGYSLQIKSFNNFRVYRGKEEITEKEWRREKAKELFLYFLVCRGEFVSKEKIFYMLWPEEDEETAGRNFKVALNALKKALEPERKPRQKPFFIRRRGSSYSLNEQAAYYFDVDEFEELIRHGEKTSNEKEKMEYYRMAVDLYQGDFLLDNPYIDWLREMREMLRSMFLNTAEELLKYYYRIKEYKSSIEIANRILEVDLCWESAYLYKIKNYDNLNRRSMAIKTYQKCKQVMDRELNVLPMAEIENLYKKLRG